MREETLIETLNEISRREVVLYPRRRHKTLSLLDIEDEVDIEFNGHNSFNAFSTSLQVLYDRFKEKLHKISSELSEKQMISAAQTIKSKLSEINILLYPNNEEMIFARVSIPRKKAFDLDCEYIKIIKKKSINMSSVNRNVTG